MASLGQLLLNFLLTIINSVVSLVSVGIVELISPLIPSSLNSILYQIGLYFGVVGDYLSFAFSYLGFTTQLINWGVLLVISIILVPFTIHNVKLLIRWWFAVKP